MGTKKKPIELSNLIYNFLKLKHNISTTQSTNEVINKSYQLLFTKSKCPILLTKNIKIFDN